MDLVIIFKVKIRKGKHCHIISKFESQHYRKIRMGVYGK